MKRAIIAALLAAVAVPANAYDYVVYHAWGSGDRFDFWSSTWSTVGVDVWMTVPLFDDFDRDLNLVFSGGSTPNSIMASYQSYPYWTATLNFDHNLTGWPLTAQGFTDGYSQSGDGFTYALFGNLRYLTVSTIKRDQTGLGSFNIIDNPVPEPASWALMIGGFALAGAALRRRSTAVRFA